MGNVKDEMEQLRIAPQQEQEKADSQQETLRSSAFEFRTLTSVSKPNCSEISPKSGIVKVGYDSEQEAGKELSEYIASLYSIQQENIQLQSHTVDLEQDSLKVLERQQN